MIKSLLTLFANSPAAMRAKQLRQAECDLVQAEFALEHYRYEVEKLNARIQRLKAPTLGTDDHSAETSFSDSVQRRALSEYGAIIKTVRGQQ